MLRASSGNADPVMLSVYDGRGAYSGKLTAGPAGTGLILYYMQKPCASIMADETRKKQEIKIADLHDFPCFVWISPLGYDHIHDISSEVFFQDEVLEDFSDDSCLWDILVWLSRWKLRTPPPVAWEFILCWMRRKGLWWLQASGKATRWRSRLSELSLFFFCKSIQKFRREHRMCEDLKLQSRKSVFSSSHLTIRESCGNEVAGTKRWHQTEQRRCRWRWITMAVSSSPVSWGSLF